MIEKYQPWNYSDSDSINDVRCYNERRTFPSYSCMAQQGGIPREIHCKTLLNHGIHLGGPYITHETPTLRMGPYTSHTPVSWGWDTLAQLLLTEMFDPFLSFDDWLQKTLVFLDFVQLKRLFPPKTINMLCTTCYLLKQSPRWDRYSERMIYPENYFLSYIQTAHSRDITRVV